MIRTTASLVIISILTAQGVTLEQRQATPDAAATALRALHVRADLGEVLSGRSVLHYLPDGRIIAFSSPGERFVRKETPLPEFKGLGLLLQEAADRH